MKNLKQLGIVVGIVCLAFCVTLMGTAFQPGPMRVHGYPNGENGGPIITETSPLFNLDGTYNADLIAELVYLAENAERGLPTLHVNNIGVSGITVSDAGHIRTANDGSLPNIRIFESHGAFSTSGMPSSGSVNDQSRDNFTHSEWQLVYITHPDGGGDPVFTFRMADAFRSNRMHTADPNWGVDIRYEGSDLRQNLIEEFDNVLDLFDNHFNIQSHFVTPANIPGQWQNTQPDTGANPVNQSLEAGARNDLIWIPSSYELGTGGNLWNLTIAERGYNQNGFGNQAWHRSSQGGNLANARSNTAAGASESIAVQSAWLSVVPAVHLSLTQLLTYANINIGFTDTSSREATSSVGNRLTIERDTGVETIIFDAGEHNTVEILLVGTGSNQFTLTPTATPVVTENTLGRFEIWYTGDGRFAHLQLSEIPQGFTIVANITNNWQITRTYNWPTGFGLASSPANSNVIAENTFAAAVAEPVESRIPNGHRFGGWWTTPSGTGTEVTSATTVANRGNTETVDVITQLFARWEQNQATVIRVNYDGTTENVGVQNVVFAGAVGDPTVEPTDQTLVFGGWWTQDGTSGNWGTRVNANTFITEAQNSTTINIYARWQIYVPRPTLSGLNLSGGTITWGTITGAEFLVAVNGVNRPIQTGNLFDFSDLAPGTHIISIRTVASNGDESDALEITVEIPQLVTVDVIYRSENVQIGTTQVLEDKENRVAPIDPERTGWQFMGWELAAPTQDNNGRWIFVFNAVWSQEFTVIFMNGISDDSQQIGTNQVVIDFANIVTPQDPERIGFTFRGWDRVESGVTVTYTAQWDRNPVLTVRIERADGTAYTETTHAITHNPTAPGPITEDRVVGDDTFTFVRWDVTTTTDATTGDRTHTFTAIWELVEEPTHIPTTTTVFAGYNPADFDGNRPTIGQTRVDGQDTLRLVGWNVSSSTAPNGDVTITNTAIWETVVVAPHIPTFTETWTGYTGTRPNIEDTRVINGVERTLVRWDTATNIASNGDVTVTHTAIWENVADNDSNFITDTLPWILIAGTGLLLLISLVLFLMAIGRGRRNDVATKSVQ